MSGSNGKRINSTASTSRRYSSYPAEEKQEAKVTYLTEFELNNQPNIRNGPSSELHNGNNLVKHSDMSIVEQSIGNIHHSSSSSTTTATLTATLNNSNSRHHIRSEDELSAVSTSKILFFSLCVYKKRLKIEFLNIGAQCAARNGEFGGLVPVQK